MTQEQRAWARATPKLSSLSLIAASKWSEGPGRSLACVA